MDEEKKPTSPAKGALAGGVFGALGAVVVGQNLSADVEASMTLTLMAVGVGLAVGSAVGFVVVRNLNKSAEP